MNQTEYFPEFEVISNFVSGDEKAFELLYRHYYDKLCVYASVYVSPDECHDVVQDTMVWLWENRHILFPEMQLKSLLFTIVKNKCLNVLSHTRIVSDVHEDLRDRYADFIESSDMVTLHELKDMINKALDKMPEELSSVFKMNRFEGVNYKEIAEKTGISHQTVAYRISQVLKILRVELKDYLPDIIFSIMSFRCFSNLMQLL